MTRVYLDHAASSPARPEAIAAALAGLGLSGNPSSIHAEGRAARAAIERARRTVLKMVEDGGGLVFTSGATEANATAIAAALAGGPGVALASAVEHPSVLAQERIEQLPVDPLGRIDLVALEQRLARGDARILALQVVNNETGVIQPVAEAARLAREAGLSVHLDAAQALGRLPLAPLALAADSLALSAHKIGGAKGAGALWLRQPERLPPFIRGGGQEGRRRAGTENTSGIMGFAAALEAVPQDEAGRLAALRDRLEAQALAIAEDAAVIAATAERVPHITALSLPGIAAQTQVMALDLAGIAVSAGSACSSGKVAASHVLQAMGLKPALLASTIRISLGWSTSEADIERFLAAWGDLARRR